MTPATLRRLQEEAARCTRCPLYEDATQVVFGEGASGGLMLVGEQPGDQEDRQGHPFVGPAGSLLRTLLEETGIPEGPIYLTNAVKHFKWRPKGTRRIHDKPTWSEVRACSHWLGLELETVQPKLVVLLGATAAQSLLGRGARVGALRGKQLELESGVPALVTLHPSAVLRAGEEREERRAELAADLELARQTLLRLGRCQSSKVTKS
jgi:uracil-DNA glycosylase family protein